MGNRVHIQMKFMQLLVKTACVDYGDKQVRHREKLKA